MSDLSDPSDRASLREQQLRDDALNKIRREQSDAAASYAFNGAAVQCVKCGVHIPKDRRDVLPYSTVCVDCARETELREKGRVHA